AASARSRAAEEPVLLIVRLSPISAECGPFQPAEPSGDVAERRQISVQGALLPAALLKHLCKTRDLLFSERSRVWLVEGDVLEFVVCLRRRRGEHRAHERRGVGFHCREGGLVETA